MGCDRYKDILRNVFLSRKLLVLESWNWGIDSGLRGGRCSSV